ncbi:SAG family member [Eimeria brunetti]|uniref:SAG family member n=1 Tax=Eimeria brunetti TaxID=51314 RepID=U6M0A9_9EIME|nr:SAG family member [Eimeria brunetti]
MAPLYRAAGAICLAALCGLKSEALQSTTYKFTAEEVTDEAYVAVNLVRNGKLPVHIEGVARDAGLATSLKAKIETDEDVAENTCKPLEIPKLKTMFYHIFDSQTAPDYRQLLQDALDEGLEVFKEKKGANTGNAWKEIWATHAGASLAHLLGSNSTAIACVIGKCTTVESDGGGGGGRMSTHLREGRSQPGGDASTEKAALFCELSPAAKADEAPFSEEYYDGLIARTDLLKHMTEDDLKAPSNDGIAPVALPAVLIAGFVAMLTAPFL